MSGVLDCFLMDKFWYEFSLMMGNFTYTWFGTWDVTRPCAIHGYYARSSMLCKFWYRFHMVWDTGWTRSCVFISNVYTVWDTGWDIIVCLKLICLHGLGHCHVSLFQTLARFEQESHSLITRWCDLCFLNFSTSF